MRGFKLYLLLGLLTVAIIAFGLGPSILRRLPTRYALRLPEPLQALALPADPTPILPTVPAPVAAAGLLPSSAANQLKPTPAAPPSPTPQPVAGQASEETAGGVQATPESTAVPPIPTARPIPVSARMEGFSHIYQEWNNCGPATLAMSLTYFGLNPGQQEVGRALRPNQEDRNVSADEMAGYVNTLPDTLSDLKAISRANGDRRLLQSLLANNVPVIIEVGIDPPGEYRWLGWYGHYLLPVAYDDDLEQFWVYDSWLGTSEVPQTNADPNGRVMPYDELEAYWSQFNRNFVVLYRPEQEALVHELLGTALDDKIMWADSLARAQLDAARDPNNAFYWFNMGTSYNALGKYDEAVLAYDQARAIGLPWRMLWYQFGPYLAYYETGRFDDVVLLAETTLEDRPYFEESYYYLGLAQAALGNEDSARQNLENAINFNPNFAPAAEALARLAPQDG